MGVPRYRYLRIHISRCLLFVSALMYQFEQLLILLAHQYLRSLMRTWLFKQKRRMRTLQSSHSGNNIDYSMPPLHNFAILEHKSQLLGKYTLISLLSD